jgi:uncharacterized protein (DUF885 family)
MNKPTLVLVFILIIISGCKKRGKENISDDLNNIFTAFYEDYLKLDPLSATALGDNRYNDLFTNYISQDFEKKYNGLVEKYIRDLSKIDQTKLSDNEILNVETSLWYYRNILESIAFNDELYPLDNLSSLQLYIPQWATPGNSQPYNTVKDYDNWLKRLDGFTEFIDTAIMNMKRGIKKGYVLPKTIVVKMIPQLDEFVNVPLTKHIFYSPVKSFPAGFTTEERSRLESEYRSAVEEKIRPIYKKLQDFLKNEYIHYCRETSGIYDLPEGEKMYQSYIKMETTTNLSADEIYEIGLKEVERITNEIEKVKEQVGFHGTYQEFVRDITKNKNLTPYTEAEQVIQHFNEINNKVSAGVLRLFEKMPATKLVVRRTEPYREASAYPEFNLGKEDGSKPGIFYVPIPDVKKYNIIEDEALFLHEAIPGHYFQISLSMENKNQPDVRRLISFNSYIEGWAMYAESLGKEFGLYTDPYQYLGMLTMDLHRALRLVIDVGIHKKGLTRDQAIQYSLEHEWGTEEAITSEIERYMVDPAQALSYKIGQIRFMELRQKAEKELGANFNIKDFHKTIFETGDVPLEVLEKKINNWIAANKGIIRK